MTNRKYVLFGVGLAFAAVATACDNSNLTNLNQDPNNPTDAPASVLFTRAVNRSTQLFLGSGLDLRGTEFMAQHLAEVQYPDEDRFTRLTGGSTTGYFDAAYYDELEDLRKAIDKGMADNDAGVWAPAMIQQAWVFENLTDIWGDIPYTSALKGDSGSITPTYDKQQDVYASLLRRLDSATTALSTASNSLGSADPIFGGRPTSWQKFSNSLRLRLAMRMVNVDPAGAKSAFEAAAAAPGGLITSNANNAELVWPADGIYDNPWSINFQTRDDHRLSERLVTNMDSVSGVPAGDPRLAVYGQQSEDNPGQYIGQPNGLTADSAAAWLTIASRPGNVFMPKVTSYAKFPNGYGPATPSYLMTAAEVNLLLAEAAQRGWTVPGTAASDYVAGIQASMDQWGVSSTAAAAYLAQPNVVYAGGVAGEKQIAVQMWIALFADGTQAWSNWRRTCQPSNVHAGPNASISTMPRRWQYSITEVSTNSDNVDAAIADMGGDAFTTRMWWDTKPTAAPTYVSDAVCTGNKQ